MSGLKSMKDEDREGKYGYVYAVSGPGEQPFHIPISLSLSPLYQTLTLLLSPNNPIPL